jgi:uncharacterized protein
MATRAGVARTIFYVLAAILLASVATPAFAQTARGTRPAYIYDNAGVISSGQEAVIDNYLRRLDDATTNEVVIYTIPSFEGHGIKKDGVEIHDRDALANYIYNELPLDGIKGIGKKGKDNGVLVLMSLERDAGGGSLRIEVGRGLEGDITDGTAGEILDSYLVPARQQYEDSGSTAAFDGAFLGTVVALGKRMGFTADDVNAPQPQDSGSNGQSDNTVMIIFVAVFIGIAALSMLGRRGRRRYGGYYGGWGGGGWGGSGGGYGGGGGGGGGSGGGGAGR